MTLQYLQPLIIKKSTATIPHPTELPKSRLEEEIACNEYFMPYSYSPYITAFSTNTKTSYPTSHITTNTTKVAFQKAVDTSTDVQAAFIKINSATGLPTQFSFAVANSAHQNPRPDEIDALVFSTSTITYDFVIKRQYEAIVLQASGFPIKDLTPAFRQAAKTKSEMLSGFGSSMGACHLQLLANGRYYAHMGNIGNNMIVVMRPDGTIKYQSGAITYAITDATHSVPQYAPTTLDDLCTTDPARAFQRHHLTQHNMELETNDIIMILTDSAWQELETEKLPISSATYTYTPDGETAPITVNIHQKKMMLKPHTLQQCVRVGRSIADINRGVASGILSRANDKNHYLHRGIVTLIDAISSPLFAKTQFTIDNFIETLPLTHISTEQQKNQVRQALRENLAKEYQLHNSAHFFLLWNQYISFFFTSKINEIWRHLPLCPETTNAFLTAFMQQYTASPLTLNYILGSHELRAAAEVIRDLFFNPEYQGIQWTSNSPLLDFLKHICNIPRGDCASVMIVKVPSYKTEIIRNWIVEHDNAETRANLFKLLFKAGVTATDLQTACNTLETESYIFNTDDYTQALGGAAAGKRYDASGSLNLKPRYQFLQRLAQESQIAAYINAIAGLQLPARLERPDIAADYAAAERIAAYTTGIAAYITTCITNGGLVQSPIMEAAATEMLVTYCSEKVLPKLIVEMDAYIAETASANAASPLPANTNVLRRRSVVEILQQLRDTSPFAIKQPANTTTWMQRTWDSRSPSQKKIDEKILKLEAEIKALTPKPGLFSSFGH